MFKKSNNDLEKWVKELVETIRAEGTSLGGGTEYAIGYRGVVDEIKSKVEDMVKQELARLLRNKG